MSLREFARIHFENDNLSQKDILERFGFSVPSTSRNYLSFSIDNKQHLQRLSMEAAKFLKSHLPNCEIVQKEDMEFGRIRDSIASEYNLQKISFQPTQKHPNYVDVRAQNLGVDEFEKTVILFKHDLEKKIGLKKLSHISRLCEPMSSRVSDLTLISSDEKPKKTKTQEIIEIYDLLNKGFSVRKIAAQGYSKSLVETVS